MSEPRGAVTGDVPETLPENPPVPEAPDEGAGAGDGAARTGDRLDASAHAHLLEEPLPPDAATETAIIYNVTLAEPHRYEAPEPITTGSTRTTGVVRRLSARLDAGMGRPGAGSGATDEAAPGGSASAVADATGAADTDEAGAPAPPARRTSSPTPTARRAGAAAAVVLVGALAGLAGYLWISATEWRDQAGLYERTAGDLGDELAGTRNQLAGSQAELEAVRAQLSTAHERIVELADEKNQALDDWEITQQLVDYQQRISEAAGTVALALDQCVQGQQELIGYLEQQVEPPPSAPPYDPALLDEFETEVEALCQDASKANIALQLALAQ